MNLNASIIKLPQKILKANVLMVCKGKHLYKIMALALITVCVIACTRFSLKTVGTLLAPLSKNSQSISIFALSNLSYSSKRKKGWRGIKKEVEEKKMA